MNTLSNLKFLKPLYVGGKRLIRFSRKNSNWILAILSTLGLLGTAATCVDATIKAVKLCEEKQAVGAKEVVKTVWKLYVAPGLCVIATTAMILENAHVNAKRLATVTGLYAASQADIKAIKEKMREIVGPKKAQQVENAVATEEMKKTEFTEADVAQTGHGNQLFKFKLNGQLFRACPDYIELVMKQFNDLCASEPDQTAYIRYLTEKFHMRESDIDNMYYDLADLFMDGIKSIRADISHTEWMELNGKQEVAAVLTLDPAPMYM